MDRTSLPFRPAQDHQVVLSVPVVDQVPCVPLIQRNQGLLQTREVELIRLRSTGDGKKSIRTRSRKSSMANKQPIGR